MSEHVIELNGKRYDAITGAQIGNGTTAPIPARPHRGKVIDGVVRKTPGASKPVPKKTSAPKAAHAPHTSTPPASKHMDITRQPARHAAPNRAMHSQTLMRNAVKRPKASLKPAIKPQAPAEVVAAPIAHLARKHSAAQVDARRMERAAHTAKHQAISRFHHEGTPVLAYASAERTITPVIAVRPAPGPTKRPPHTPIKSRNPASHDIFEAALHRATSHKELPHKTTKKRRRLVNTFAGIAAFLVLGGFIGYLNMPTIELQIASLQAGFHASLPDYRPAGYARTGGIERVGGTVSVSFRSGAHNYTVTQQASDWNSQTLLDNTLALGGEHATIQKNGQTIYVYGNGMSAAWVNGGVRYDLTGNAALSKDDIASIATSL